MTTELRIYVASLSDYNAGILHGVWIDCDGKDSDNIMEDVRAMLAESPAANKYGEPAEEWAIHDHEGFPEGSISEWTGFETVAQIAAALEEHGDAFRAALDYYGANYLDEALEATEDRYCGQHGSREDWAEQFLEDTGQLERIPEDLRFYFDFGAYARDAALSGDMVFISDGEGGVHVFHAH